MRRSYLYLVLILIAALTLRIVYLGSVPQGFTPDEASQAYSAYSLLQTGKDEWETSWPTTSFKSFLDYKAPLQTYLMMPSIAVFGLNEFAARLPSAIFGVLAVLAVYLLSTKLFSPATGLVAAFVLAISPWHLQFSRMALEVNLFSFLFPIGLYYFLIGLEKPKSFAVTAFAWGIALYSYHAAKIFFPLFLLGLVLIYRSQLKIKNLLIPTILFVIIISPQIFGTIFGKASTRGVDLVVSNLDKTQLDEIHRAIAYSSYRTPKFVLEKLLHNKFTYSLDKFVENYLSYLSPSFWFTEGGRETTYSVIPGRGLLYLWQLPFILLALYNLAKTKNKHLPLLLLWFLVAAIPAAITKEGYRPNRAGSYATLMEIFTAYGVWLLLFQNQLRKKYLAMLAVIIAISFIAYQEDYYSASITKFPTTMSYGWREAINHLKPLENMYKEVRVNKGSQSQTFFAFYLPISPDKFQEYSRLWGQAIASKKDVHYLDQLDSYNLAKYRFSRLNWPEDIDKEVIYISYPDPTLPPSRNTIHLVKSGDHVLLEIFDFNK